MQWSPQQDAALKAIGSWLSDPAGSQVFRLDGYAGTGKTTLAVHAAAGVDGRVLFAAPTGKAAHVMRRKGCTGASTVHQLIYNTKDQSRARLRDLEADLTRLIGALNQDEQEDIDNHPDVVALRDLIRDERKNLARPSFTLNPESVLAGASLLVLDESSMIDGRVGEDILSFKTKVLAIGDPAQLPPVRGEGFFFNFEDRKADATLTEIHRQALDNPIIRMATDVRNHVALERGTYGESRVISKDDMEIEQVMAVDQIIVGRNRTRHRYNARIREILGMDSDLPVPGDRLVCLRNNHDLGLFNGSTWDVRDSGPADRDDQIVLEVESTDEPDYRVECTAHAAIFLGEEIDWFSRRDAQEFCYGYAMTGHKSQGSQWDDVLLIDESACFRKDKWKWLYTGITRAAERITIVS